MSAEQPKKVVEIEAPTTDQIRAAKRMRRQMDMPMLEVTSEVQKKGRRFLIEGIALLLVAGALAFFLHPLGEVSYVIALIPCFAGIGLLIKGSMDAK